jgi:hypothetical protein
MSVSMMCWGARLMLGGIAYKTPRFSRRTTVGNHTEYRLEPIEFLDQIRGTFAVAPVPDFPGPLGRVKGSLAPLAAVAPLTRPARSRVVGNYRSDGEIQRTICARPAGDFSSSALLQSCVLTNPLSNPHDRSTMFFSLV